MIAVGNRPCGAKFLGQLRGVTLRAECINIDIMKGGRQSADPHFRPVNRTETCLGRDPGPDISHQRALNGMCIGSWHNHCGSAGNRPHRLILWHAAQHRYRRRGTDRRKTAMRMKHKVRKGEDARHSGNSLITKNKRPHQILHGVFLGLSLSQQGRQAIHPGVTDHTPIALIQFGPVSGTSVCQCSGIAIEPMPSRIEHRCLGSTGAVRNPVMKRHHLRFTSRRNNGAKIVTQDKRRTLPHRHRNVRPFGAT